MRLAKSTAWYALLKGKANKPALLMALEHRALFVTPSNKAMKLSVRERDGRCSISWSLSGRGAHHKASSLLPGR